MQDNINLLGFAIYFAASFAVVLVCIYIAARFVFHAWFNAKKDFIQNLITPNKENGYGEEEN